jgi:two-component system, NtrC family, sensor kinase
MSQWRRLIWLGKVLTQRGGQPQNRVVPLVIIGTTLAVSTTALISYQVGRRLILNNLKQHAFLHAQLGSKEIDDWLATRKAEVETLANTPTVRSMQWSAIEAYLQSELKRLTDFYHFSLIYPDGSYYTTRIGRANANLKDRKHVQTALAGTAYVADPLISRSIGVVIVPIAAPIWSDSPGTRQPIGVMNGNIKLNRLAKVVRELKYGPGSYAFALNSEGKPIVHPNLSVIGTPEHPAPSFLAAKDRALRQIATRMVEKRSKIERVRIDGKGVYVAYLPLRQADWSIALVIPYENIEAKLEVLNRLAVVVGVLLGAATFAALRQLVLSERLRARAERAALLNRLTGRIRASLDIEQILQTTVEEVATLLHLERAAYVKLDPQQPCLEVQREYCREGLPKQVGRFNVLPGENLERRLQQSEALRLTPAASNLNQSQPGLLVQLELKAHSYLALPVRGDSGTLGYLICIHATRHSWTAQERELLQAVADQLAIAIIQSLLYIQSTEQVQLLGDALRELKRTQAYLVHSEKMSSLGQMVGGIAHEINNPISFIYGNLFYINQYLDDLLALLKLYKQTLPNCPPEIWKFEAEIELDFIEEDLPQILNSMKTGAERIRQIILSLRNFTRLDESEMKAVDIHEGIDNTLLLLNNRLKDQICVVKKYSNLPLVDCYASQLNQVFINLLNNAIDALQESTQPKKAITIATVESPNSQKPSIRISIADNGPGIPPEIQPKIFDPFFTTKKVGSGTGLGLSISYQIVVELHGGQISVHTPPDGGAEFVVEIPIQAKSGAGDRKQEIN